MARRNLIPNPSFRQGLEGYSGVNGGIITVSSNFAFYGAESIKVSKSAQNSSGVQTSLVETKEGLDYAFSAYVYVPSTVPSTDDANLLLTISWYSGDDGVTDPALKSPNSRFENVLLSSDTSDVSIVRPRQGWVRLTGVAKAPLGAFRARLSATQLAGGRAKQVFYVDAFLLEQSSYVGGYLDNVDQAEETHLTNSGLSALPLPPIGGLSLDADVILGDLVLNTVDENNVVWVCTDIVGWWNHAETDAVDIPRGVEDGSYDVSGRFQARTLTLSGSFLLPDPKLLPQARDRLIAATNIIRKGVWLRTNESPTRAAFVRLNGRPEIETVNARGRTDFSIGLKAADPIRYGWNDEDPDGLHTESASLEAPVTNLSTNPNFESSTDVNVRATNLILNPSAEGSTSSLSAFGHGTFYSWTGTADASPSIERTNGVETRRNDIIDPRFTNTNAWYKNPNATYDFSTMGNVKITATAAITSGSLVTYTAAAMAPTQVGIYKAASYLITNTGTIAHTIYGNIRAYGQNASTDGPTSADLVINPGETKLFVLPAVLPLSTNDQGYRALIRTRGMAVNETLVVAQALGETVASASATPGVYFDGTTVGTGTNPDNRPAVPIVADPVTGNGNYSYASTANSRHTQEAISATQTAIAGQTWQALARVRTGAATVGARTVRLTARFRYSNGTTIGTGVSVDQVIASSGIATRWTGDINNSSSVRYEGEKITVNRATNPRGILSTSILANNSSLNTHTWNTAVAPTPNGSTTALMSQRVSTASPTQLMSAYNVDGLGSLAESRQIGAYVRVNVSNYRARFANSEWTNLTLNTWTWITGTVTGFSSVAIERVDGAVPSTADRAYITDIIVPSGTTPPLPTDFFDGNTVNVGKGTVDTPFDLAVSAVAPSGASTVELVVSRVGSAGTFAGDVVQVDHLLLANSTTDLTYFDGSSSPDTDGDYYFRWTGTANASTSEKYWNTPYVAFGESATVITSSVWSSSGTSSLRIVPQTNAYNQSGARLTSLVSGGLLPGVQYTVSVIAHRETDGTVTGALSYEGLSGTSSLLKRAVVIPKQAGTYPVSMTFTVPLEATTHRLFVYSNEITGGPNMWIDDLIITLGSEPEPYFDGSTENTDASVYKWNGNANKSTSVKTPTDLMITSVTNTGTSDVTAVFELVGPLGPNSTIYNSLTDQTITTTDELRGVGGAATVISKELTNNTVTLTTDKPHNLVVGDVIIVAGVGSPFDSVNETFTVTGVTELLPYTFNYKRIWPDLDVADATGRVSLAYNDVLSIDTYNRSVTFNGEVRGNRSRVTTLIDWIKLAPGENVIRFVDAPSRKRIISKGRKSNLVTITTSEAHYFVPGEQVFIDLPTSAQLAKKRMDTDVATITTTEPHGMSKGDSITIESTESSTIARKALSNSTATLTTTVAGGFNVNDLITVSLPVNATITSKASTTTSVTMYTSKPHGYSSGDLIQLSFSTGASITYKSRESNTVTIGTASSHGFSIGDFVTVSLPTTTTIVSKYTSGQTVLMTTNGAHNFAKGDRVSVALPITATTTATRSYVSSPTYYTTVTTTAAHNFVTGDRIMLDDVTRIVETVPSATTFTYLDYSRNSSGTFTTGAKTVTNLTNVALNGTYPILNTSSSYSSPGSAIDQFSYTV